MSSPLERIRALIHSKQSFLIASHEEPEGDCLGSSLALWRALYDAGKDVACYNADGVPHTYSFLSDADVVKSELKDTRWDVAFVLDCGCLERLGGRAQQIVSRADVVVNIDHHLSNEGFGAICLLDPGASSTGELIYRLLTFCELPIADSALEALLCAIYTDTGSFRYANTTAQSFEIAAEAVRRGVSPWQVAKGMYERNPVSRIQALSRALATIEVGPQGGWCVMTVSSEMLAATGASRHDTEGFINYARSLEGVEVAILIREDAPDMQKVSLRSKGLVNVSDIARALGGGGHHNAAACRLPMDVSGARKRLLPLVEQALGSRRS